MFETRKMKKTTVCATRLRSRFVCSSGRISSIEAPVVPTNDASSAPAPSSSVFVRVRGLEVALEQDAARDDEQAAEQHDERHVVERRVSERLRVGPQIEDQHGQGEDGRDSELPEVRLPEVGRRERQDRDREQQADERQRPGDRGDEGLGVHRAGAV